jgi:hypothetical protein
MGRIVAPLVLVVLLGWGAVGCVNNVELCEEWAASMDCGGVEFGDLVTCDDFRARHCYLYDYFDCLTENASCDDENGSVDTSLWDECEPLDSCGR